MKVLSFVSSMFLICSVIAQIEDNLFAFEELTEVTLGDNVKFDEWILSTSYYPSGNKRDEVKVYISSSCLDSKNCKIKYQHQVYYDGAKSVIALKEGKYFSIKNDRVNYRNLAWWYTNTGKEFRRISEKTTKKL